MYSVKNFKIVEIQWFSTALQNLRFRSWRAIAYHHSQAHFQEVVDTHMSSVSRVCTACIVLVLN